MNRRGGFGPIGFIILFLILLFMYPFVFAPMFTQAGDNAIAAGATGLEAFGWRYLNVWVILTLLFVAGVYFYLGGNNQ
jgi:hypothetical protein